MKIAVNDYLELYTDDGKMGYVVNTRTGEKYAATSLASIL